jgi:pimeloyl-ACP methyl ester carboxylesterase
MSARSRSRALSRSRARSRPVALPTALLLHAFPLDSRMWAEQCAALERAGHPVTAPDLPGEPLQIGFDAWASRVLAQVEGDLVPVGSSMGGYLAFELWRQASERILALALVGSRATADTPEQREARDETIRVLGEDGFEPFWNGIAAKLFAAGTDPQVVERARAIASEQPLTALVATLETLRDRLDSRQTLPSIDVPVLVAVGEEDQLTPQADAEAMVEQIPNARFLRIARAGHLASLERPDEVNAALLELLEGLP